MKLLQLSRCFIVCFILFLPGCEAQSPTNPPPEAVETGLQQEAILRGLDWLESFIADDDNLYAVFSNFVLMLNELTIRDPAGLVGQRAQAMLRDCFARVEGHLDRVFESNEDGLWEYISILYLVKKWGIDGRKLIDYQTIRYPEEMSRAYEEGFKKALAGCDYDALSDILIDTSFAYFYRERFPESAGQLPGTGFSEYIQKIAGLSSIHTLTSDRQGYSDQNYYMTHVVFVLSEYGERPLPDTRLTRKVRKYLLSEFENVRYHVRDLDLLAEFVHCLKIYGEGERPEVREAIQFLLTRQNGNGSWGTKEDFSGTPYDQFHPTWTVITALNY